MTHHGLRLPIGFLGVFLATNSCGARIPKGDVSALIRDRSASWLVDSSASYSPQAGYGTSCAHPGAHAILNAGTHNVYAVADGIIASIESCATAGENDKYNISLALGMKGAVPVFFDYSIEPFAGTVCSNGNDDYFSSQILVEEGQSVTRGQLIARMVAVGSGAHIHFALGADGATICPEIFPASIFTGQTGALASATCGTDPIAASTLCHQPTTSENPENLQ